ncbi:ATP-binding protein [Pseudomonas oryzihabitans]|uniref:AlbA family DNA-binding domain-containing protein n=1 Tax=Pseudomonas oryzihabitans TaxID=47885 RepID=UPI0018D7AEA6|nr:ATP-binding protein [Pseudomonas oryzihabitans]MBH3331876.1 ATP-binding protein [Pseudomonas oryzihabitans]
MNIGQIKSQILSAIECGNIGTSLIDELKINDETLVGYESELWDYKLTLQSTKLGLAEFVRDVIAFYNSHGGYLILGVADGGEIRGTEELNHQQCAQAVRNYSGIDIPIKITNYNTKNGLLQLVFIPKRAASDVPLPISKNGPDVTERKPLFRPGDIFFRSTDNSQLIRDASDLRFLMGAREHPDAKINTHEISLKTTTNNLPDRSAIFQKFIGRETTKEELWAWLADPMSRYRVLAGPGGVGKTSAAYSFCEAVCSEAPLGLEQVVWLSAKLEQFSPSVDKPIALPYKRDPRVSGEAYSSYDTLLDAISFHFAIPDEDWNEIDHNYKIKHLAEGLSIIPSLVIVDDLDSLPPDDQRKAVELGMSLGNSKSRFLFTTRKNFLAPLSSTTEVKGMLADDFYKYLEYLENAYRVSLSNSERKTLHRDAEGSPLFTESIFRLLKLGIPFGEAMNRWKGKDGEAVRAASFRREFEQLTWNSKRVLYSISMFENVSSAEIKNMTECETSEVEVALAELDRLFLIQTKQIGNQHRFGLPPSLRRLLDESKSEIQGSNEISRRASRIRVESKEGGASRGKNRNVANAIQQAMAQLSGKDALGALNTVQAALKEYSSSPDLWMVHARCLAEVNPGDVVKVRESFQCSYDFGKREPQLFIKWIQFEVDHGNSNAAVDVGEKGRTVFSPKDWIWHRSVAVAHMKRGSERESRREYQDAATDLTTATKRLKSVLRNCPISAKATIIPLAQEAHDRLWTIHKIKGERFTYIDRYKSARLAVEAEDKREICLDRMMEAIEEAVHDHKGRGLLQATDWISEFEKTLQNVDSERLDFKIRNVKNRIKLQNK